MSKTALIDTIKTFDTDGVAIIGRPPPRTTGDRDVDAVDEAAGAGGVLR